MQRLGQHFLKNESAIGNIIAALSLQTGDKVVEIGPGKGALTLPLLQKIKDLSGRLIAIEKDRALIPALYKAVDKLGKSSTNNEFVTNKRIFRIMEGDALEVLPSLRACLSGRQGQAPRNDEKDWKLVGNIPYYITGHLLRIIGELPHKPSITVLMIQKEVAERVTAKPPKMNLLAAATQIWADISIVQTLKPSDFEPAPEVESAIVKVVPRQAQELKPLSAELSRSNTLNNYYKFIKIAFKQPRKTLLNNLATSEEKKKSEIASEDLAMTKKEDTLSVLRQNGYDEKTRAQDLSVEELLKLSQVFCHSRAGGNPFP